MIARYTHSTLLFTASLLLISSIETADARKRQFRNAPPIRITRRLPFATTRSAWSLSPVRSSTTAHYRDPTGWITPLLNARGGADSENTTSDDIEYDDEEESEEEEEDFYDAVQEIDGETSEESDSEEQQDEVSTEGIQIEVSVNKFDDPLVQSPMSGLFVSLGVMYLSRKVDLFSPNYVRVARWAFVGYLLVLQAFVFYFRIQAKKENNQTPIELQNPLFTILQNKISPQTAQDNSNDMVKNIASSFLSNKSTIMDYDLQQTRNMQSGILFSIIMQWVLHFKFEQIQPLIMASLNGMFALVYSPLFQVYVLGKNLERPFKSPAMLRQEQAVESPDTQLQDDANTIDENEESKLEQADDEDEDEYDQEEEVMVEESSLQEEEDEAEESTFEDAV